MAAVDTLCRHYQTGYCKFKNSCTKLYTNISKCEYCHFEFLSQDQLEAHAEKMIAACEECGLCFESEYLSDVHEHDKHTEEYFEVNSLTPTSKRRAYERLELESGR